MYVADYQGTPTDPAGRVLLRGADGSAEAVLTGVAHPNGIVLTPDQTALWIDEDLSGTLDHVAEGLSSPAGHAPGVRHGVRARRRIRLHVPGARRRPGGHAERRLTAVDRGLTAADGS